MLTNEFNSSGYRASFVPMLSRQYYFDCLGVCGRKGLMSTAKTAKYCGMPKCQAKKKADSYARKRKRMERAKE